jgi:hypothetical protein
MNETATAGITANDVKAMRTCDSVCFYHADGKGAVSAVKRGKAPWYEESRHDVPCQASSLTVYGTDRTHDPSAVKCFALVSFAREKDTWQTVAGLLRAGDVLELSWVGANNSECLKRANLFADELYLVVVRGKRRMTFNISYQVCPDNTARMVRPRG